VAEKAIWFAQGPDASAIELVRIPIKHNLYTKSNLFPHPQLNPFFLGFITLRSKKNGLDGTISTTAKHGIREHAGHVPARGTAPRNCESVVAEMRTKISKCLKITFQHFAKQRARAEVIKRSETNRGVKRRRVEDSDSESATVDNTSKRPKSMENLDIYFRCKEPYFESETKVSPVCTIPVCRLSPKFLSPNYYLSNYL